MSTKEARAFHFKHNGLVDKAARRKSANHLADAETWAEQAGVEFRWDDDDCVPDRELPEDSERLCASAWYQGECLASIGGIEMKSPTFIHGVAQDPYVRVINAQLASEAWDLVQLRERAKECAQRMLKYEGEGVIERFNRDAAAFREGRGPRDQTHTQELARAYLDALRDAMIGTPTA